MSRENVFPSRYTVVTPSVLKQLLICQTDNIHVEKPNDIRYRAVGDTVDSILLC